MILGEYQPSLPYARRPIESRAQILDDQSESSILRNSDTPRASYLQSEIQEEPRDLNGEEAEEEEDNIRNDPGGFYYPPGVVPFG